MHSITSLVLRWSYEANVAKEYRKRIATSLCVASGLDSLVSLTTFVHEQFYKILQLTGLKEAQIRW